MQADDQPRIKRALEKHDSQGTHLYVDYEEKLFKLSKLVKLSQRYSREAKEIEEQVDCCCICLEKFGEGNGKAR